MTLNYCRAPAAPAPLLSNTDLIDRLSLLRPNLIRFSRFTYAGGAYAENPHTDPPVAEAYGAQKKALILPGGDADVEALLVDRDYGAATLGHNGGAYSISFYAWLRGGGTAGSFQAGFRDSLGGAIGPSSFSDPAILDAADDVTFNVTDVPTLFTVEHLASDDEGFWGDAPNNAVFKLFVTGASDIPAGSELVISEFQMQNDDFYAPWAIDLPWRPARGEEDLAQYTEYVLSTNFLELANRRRQRVTSNLEGVGLVLETNGPVRVVDVPEDSFVIDASSDGTLYTTTGTDPDVVQQIVIPPNDAAAIRTKSRVEVRQGGDSPFEIVPGAGVTINPPVGGSLRSVGLGSVMVLTKRSSSDIWDVTSTANPLQFLAFERGEFDTVVATGVMDSRRFPADFTVIGVRANVHTAQATGSILTFDFKVAGVSILSTLLTLDNTEETSQTAAAPAVLSSTQFDDDAKVTFECTQIGDGTAKGARAWLIGYATNASQTGAALEISGTPVTTGAVGVAYAGFTVSATGGVGPYVFSIASGALPAGLTLNSSTGAVAGTPTTEETQSGIVIRVTDIAGSTDDLAAFSIAVAADSDFGDVVLLIGADSSIVDESASAHTLTIGSGVTRDTGTAKFGPASVALPDNTGGTFTAPASSDWSFGLNSFTLEAWVSLDADNADAGTLNTLFSQGDPWYTQFEGQGSGVTRLAHYVSSVMRIYYDWTFTAGQFYHLAVTRNHAEASGTWRLFIDGVMVAKAVNTVTGNGQTGSVLRIGGRFADNRMMHGHVDEVRLTRNVARYISDGGFTPPTAAFPRG